MVLKGQQELKKLNDRGGSHFFDKKGRRIEWQIESPQDQNEAVLEIALNGADLTIFKIKFVDITVKSTSSPVVTVTLKPDEPRGFTPQEMSDVERGYVGTENLVVSLVQFHDWEQKVRIPSRLASSIKISRELAEQTLVSRPLEIPESESSRELSNETIRDLISDKMGSDELRDTLVALRENEKFLNGELKENPESATFRVHWDYTRSLIELGEKNLAHKLEKKGQGSASSPVREIRPEDTTILIADDDFYDRRTLRDILERNRFKVIEAKHGQKAFEIIKSGEKVDLVIADQDMAVPYEEYKIPEDGDVERYMNELINTGDRLVQVFANTHPKLRVIIQTGNPDIKENLIRLMKDPENGLKKVFPKKLMMGEEDEFIRQIYEVLETSVASPVGLPEGNWERWIRLSRSITLDDINHDMFRDYDFRSVGPRLKPEMVFYLGLVWAKMAIKKAEKAGIKNRTVLLAKDARKIEPELEDALVAALRYSGLDVVYIAKDTPNAITSYSWAAQEIKPLMSIIITASHMSMPVDVIIRGFKIAMQVSIGGDVQSLETEEIKNVSKATLKNIIQNPDSISDLESSQKGIFDPKNIDPNVIRFNALVGRVAVNKGSLYEFGKAIKESPNPLQVLDEYEINYTSNHYPLKGIRIVVEGSHTPSGKLAANTFRNLGADVILINGDIHEIVGEHNADPSIEENLKDLEIAIIENDADFGIAFDLDGDRGAIHVPKRTRDKSKVQFQTLTSDNVIVTLLPSLMSDWGYNDKRNEFKIGVIRDVLSTRGVDDRARELGVEPFKTNAGYVYLKAKKATLEPAGYLIAIIGEKSGHIFPDFSGVIENPVAVSVLFALLVKQEQKSLFDKRIRGESLAGETINPVMDVFESKATPYSQSPRFQPPFHPKLLENLSNDERNNTPWRFDFNDQLNNLPPQSIIALGQDLAIQLLKKEFVRGKSYETPAGTLTVGELDFNRDNEGLYRYADIYFELNGEFAGRMVFRASSNDPTFVASYEAYKLDDQFDTLRQSIAGIIFGYLISEEIVIVDKNIFIESMPHLEIQEQREFLFKKLNLPFVEKDVNAFRKKMQATSSSPVSEQVAIQRTVDAINAFNDKTHVLSAAIAVETTASSPVHIDLTSARSLMSDEKKASLEGWVTLDNLKEVVRNLKGFEGLALNLSKLQPSNKSHYENLAENLKDSREFAEKIIEFILNRSVFPPVRIKLTFPLLLTEKEKSDISERKVTLENIVEIIKSLRGFESNINHAIRFTPQVGAKDALQRTINTREFAEKALEHLVSFDANQIITRIKDILTKHLNDKGNEHKNEIVQSLVKLYYDVIEHDVLTVKLNQRYPKLIGALKTLAETNGTIKYMKSDIKPVLDLIANIGTALEDKFSASSPISSISQETKDPLITIKATISYIERVLNQIQPAIKGLGDDLLQNMFRGFFKIIQIDRKNVILPPNANDINKPLENLQKKLRAASQDMPIKIDAFINELKTDIATLYARIDEIIIKTAISRFLSVVSKANKAKDFTEEDALKLFEDDLPQILKEDNLTILRQDKVSIVLEEYTNGIVWKNQNGEMAYIVAAVSRNSATGTITLSLDSTELQKAILESIELQKTISAASSPVGAKGSYEVIVGRVATVLYRIAGDSFTSVFKYPELYANTLLKIFVGLEDEFDISITNDEMDKITRVTDVFNLVWRKGIEQVLIEKQLNKGMVISVQDIQEIAQRFSTNYNEITATLLEDPGYIRAPNNGIKILKELHPDSRQVDPMNKVRVHAGILRVIKGKLRGKGAKNGDMVTLESLKKLGTYYSEDLLLQVLTSLSSEYVLVEGGPLKGGPYWKIQWKDDSDASSPLVDQVDLGDGNTAVFDSGGRLLRTGAAALPIAATEDLPLGGINLNPALMDLQIKRDGNGIPLPFNLQPIEIMNIEGFIPVIINVTPVLNVPLLLGFDMPDTNDKPYDSADSEPTSSTELGFVDRYRHKYIRQYQDENIDA